MPTEDTLTAEARKVEEEINTCFTVKNSGYLNRDHGALRTILLAYAQRVREPLEAQIKLLEEMQQAPHRVKEIVSGILSLRAQARSYADGQADAIARAEGAEVQADRLRAQLAEAQERFQASENLRAAGIERETKGAIAYNAVLAQLEETRRERDEALKAWEACDRQLAEAVELREAAEARVHELGRAAIVVRRATDAIEGSLKQELADAEAERDEFLATVARHSELLCADCDRRIREDDAALQARPEARTPEPKDPLSIPYGAVTHGREWPRPEHKRVWNQERDDSWCDYCHVQWPCLEVKP